MVYVLELLVSWFITHSRTSPKYFSKPKPNTYIIDNNFLRSVYNKKLLVSFDVFSKSLCTLLLKSGTLIEALSHCYSFTSPHCWMFCFEQALTLRCILCSCSGPMHRSIRTHVFQHSSNCVMHAARVYETGWRGAGASAQRRH